MTQHLTATTAVQALFRFVESSSHSTRPFIVAGEHSIAYGQLHELLRRVAGVLRDSGAHLGDRVVICSRHDLVTTVLYLGAMRAGVTPALIDPDSSLDEVSVLVQAAQARCLFVDAPALYGIELRQRLLPGGVILDTDVAPSELIPAWLYQAEERTLEVEVPDDASAFILFTSGTTSRPKGVEVSVNAVSAHMATMHRQYGYGPDSVVVNGLPLHHSDGINHGPVNIMACGGTLIRPGAFTVQRLPAILDLIATGGATHWITVPTVLALVMRLGSEFDEAFRRPRFRFVSSTAGPLDERLWRRFEERFGTMIVNGYGLTETVCEGFYCGPSPDTRRIGTIGKPIDIEAKIISADGRPAAEGEMGELILRGSCVMKGYFDAPEETAEVLKDGWLYTGDLAIRDSDGFYTITGRKKNVIICGGANVYPEDVSRTIMRLPGVLDAVTVGAPDRAFGERVVSCVVLDPRSAVGLDRVVRHCKEHLARERVPSRIFEVSELPRGPSGKIALPQVRQLVADLLRREQGERGHARWRDPASVAQRVLELAAGAFQCEVSSLSMDSEPESTDGWSSLAHMDFLLALEGEFDLQIAPQDMLDIVTLGDASEFVRRQVATRD